MTGSPATLRRGGLDLNDGSKWRPLFALNLAQSAREELTGVGVASIQLARLAYPPPLSDDEARDLGARITDRLRDAITSWRTGVSREAKAYPVFAPDTRAKVRATGEKKKIACALCCCARG